VRIAYICKCRYMGHHVISDRYARLYEQPRQLARRGHEVLGVCLNYIPGQGRHDEWHEAEPGQLHWVAFSCGFLHLLTYPQRALRALRIFGPDLLVAASDCPHVAIGSWFANRLKVPYAVDLYDHFESFGLCRIPGLISLYRNALRKARCVSCVSEPLAQWVRDLKGDASAVLALPSTVDRDLLRPRDRLACRRSLGLPVHAQLVGSAGGLSRSKGIATLYQAFDWLADRMPDLHLVLAGTVEPSCPPPDHPRVHLLGSLSHARIAELFSALDVGVVYLRDTAYGRFSFPQKAYEMAACGLPLVIARVGAMADTFAGSGAEFYAADDALALASGLERQLASPKKPDVVLTDWAQQAEILEGAYREVLSRKSF